jgi:hypothetical protein
MLRRLLIASVCTTVLAVAAPATASSPVEVSASDRAGVPVKKVVRQYGDGPVLLKKGQDLKLRFRGERGDQVQLAKQYRDGGRTYVDAVYEDLVSIRGSRTIARVDGSRFFRLRESGWFTLRFAASVRDTPRRVQLLKRVVLQHTGKSLKVPERRGYAYAVQLQTPRSGIRLATFGTRISNVHAQGDRYPYSSYFGQSLVIAPGLPLLGADEYSELSAPLKPGQKVLVDLAAWRPGRVAVAEPRDVGRTSIDGPAIELSGSGTEAVLTEIAASDLARSAHQLLDVRVTDPDLTYYWRVLVLPEAGGLADEAATSPRAAPLYQLDASAGTYRVLVFPTSRKVSDTTLELDSVADGGTIARDGAPVTVPARADGRYTLLGITQPQAYMPSYLSISDVTVPGSWTVYAGWLTRVDCTRETSLGCGDGNGVGQSVPGNGSMPLYGGYVLTMPLEGQTTGSFTVKLSSTRTYP